MTGLGDDFDKFHASNPRVYELFKRFAFEAMAAGHKHFSADMVCHQVRWETTVVTKGDTYKINDHWVSRYSRLFALHYPEYSEFFRTRALREERAQVAA